MRYFLALLLIIPLIALASDPLIPDLGSYWTIPDTYADGSELPIDKIDGYMVTRKYNDMLLGEEFVPGGLTTEYITVDAKPGVYIFGVAAVVEGEVSQKYNLSTVTLAQPKKQVNEFTVELRLICDDCSLEVK